MPQSQSSGLIGNNFGRETASKIADLLGAQRLSKSSNEFSLGGKRAVIKCAQSKTTSVGVTYLMLERVDLIIGAFEGKHGAFELYLLEPEVFKGVMTPTRSKGPSSGRVGIVQKSTFLKHGLFLKTLVL